jgi:hypothetical protein
VRPTDTVLIFDRGKQAVKVNTSPLRTASHFFHQALNCPLLPNHIRIIRLRDDFPYAIRALIEFIDTDKYTFQTIMHAEYPTVTMLDLHIHAYLAGAKYAVPRLCERAVKQYIALGDMCLQMDFDPTMRNHIDVMAVDPAHPPPSPISGMAIVKCFLESFALLWRNTPHRFDAMRAAVLELIKHYLTPLSRLPLFAMLMRELDGFARDVEESLGDDGLEATTYFVREGEKCGVRFG